MSSARVAALHRYPVKSMLGEVLGELDVDGRGVVGDRLWSVRTTDGKIGSGKTTRRFAAVIGLLEFRARTTPDGVLVRAPAGDEFDVADPRLAEVLSTYVGQPVTVAKETDVMHFDDGPVSLLTTASVDALAEVRAAEVAVERFRPNVVVSGPAAFEDEDWIGREIEIGSCVLRPTMRSPRCVMVDMATADLAEQHGNLRALGRLNDACLGVIAEVLRPGRIALGDAVRVS